MRRHKISTLLLTAFLLLVLPTCRWSQFRADASHSGQNYFDQTTPATVSGFALAFDFDTQGIGDFRASPAVDQIVTIGNLPGFGHFPSHFYQAVFIAGYYGDVYAINESYCKVNRADCNTASSKATFWQQGFDDSFVSSPATDQNVVYLGGTRGVLYALDLTKGTVLWKGQTAGRIFASPTIVGQEVYVGSSDGQVYGFSTAGCQGTCAANYHANVGTGHTPDSPAVVNGTLFVGDSYEVFSPAGSRPPTQEHGFGQVVSAFDASTGAFKWNFAPSPNIQDADTPPAISVLNGIVYAVFNDANLYALDAGDGSEVWYQPVAYLGHASAPAVVTENCQTSCQTFIYISGTGGLYKIDDSGNMVWGPVGGTSLLGTPSIANNGPDSVIFATSSDGYLYAFDVSGNAVFPHPIQIGTALTNISFPSLVDTVYVAGNDPSNGGQIYAFSHP